MIGILETPISFLKPEELLKAEERYASKEIGNKELELVQDKAISELVIKQCEVGLDFITDGFFRSVYGLRDFWMDLEGVTTKVVTSGRVYQDQNAGEVVPMVTAKIGYNPAHRILDNFSFLHREVGDASLVRMDLPAPSHFLLEVARNGWCGPTLYTSLEEMSHDISWAYYQTLLELYERGCRRVLLIDPCWGRLCDRYAYKRLLQGGLDMVKLPELLRQTNQRAIEELPRDMHIILYLPFEDDICDFSHDILNEAFSVERIDSYVLDWNGKDTLELVRRIRPGHEVVIGVGDPSQPQMENLDNIAQVLKSVATVNPELRLGIGFKGGFINNTNPIDFSTLTQRDEWNKISNMLILRQMCVV